MIARLLANRDRLSRLEKEAVLDAVLAAAAPARRTRWWFIAAPALAAACALVLILFAPWRRDSASPDQLATRGGGSLIGAFAPSCTSGCGRGDKIVFDLQGTTGYRYFAAFAQRTDGTVLWYFPSAPDGTSIDLAEQLTSGVLGRGIVIGDEHSPGAYRIYGVFSREPLTRQQLRERFDENRVTAGPNTQVIVKELEVR